MSQLRSLLVDVHTHLYLPRYADLLRSRSSVPYIRSRADGDRLVILDNEPSGGRPVGSQYWDRNEKLTFMNKHNIDISIVSTANPWLDFLSSSEATPMARDLNNDLEEYCATGPSISIRDQSSSKAETSLQRLYGMGLLPLVADTAIEDVLKEVQHIADLKHLKGVIMGTRGLGKGFDDNTLEPLWRALAEKSLIVFLHPHYGVPLSSPVHSFPNDEAQSNGHVLPLALGFPFETTLAASRLILSGVMERHPSLKILLAHSGGALPLLSSRLESCVRHDPEFAGGRLPKDVRAYLGQFYTDSVAYGSEELSFVSATLSRASRYPASSVTTQSGSSRMSFGTDHPFFPPFEANGGAATKWESVVENENAIEAVQDWTSEQKEGVRGWNALRLFGII